MRGTGAGRRREQDRSRPPDAAAAVAKLERACDDMDAAHGRLRACERAIADAIARLEATGTGCGEAERLAVLAGNLADRLAVTAVELIAGAAHCEEARRQGEALAPLVAFTPAMLEAAIAEGRRREAEERDRRARVPRHARGRHLKAIPGVPGAVARAAVAGIVVAGAAGSIVAVHEESSVRAVAVAPARHAAHQMAPDRVAVPRRAPQPPSSSSRPSAAAASASPAPAVAPGLPFPSLSAPPPAPVTASPGPVLAVPRLLDLGDSIRGVLPLSATGTGEVAWTATGTDGIVLYPSAGVVVPGQPVTLTVLDPTGGGGMIHVSFGGTTIPVEVTSDVGTSVLPLP